MFLFNVNVPQFLWLLCFCVLVLWIIVRFFKLRRYQQLSEKVPSAYWNLPFIGITYMFIGTSDVVDRRVSHLLTWCPNISKYWFGNYLIYVVNNADYLEGVLNEANKPPQYNLFSPAVGYGLITIPSLKQWKHHRKIITPMFNKKTMNEIFDIITAQYEIMVKVLSKEVSIDNTSIDFGRFLANASADSVCKSLLHVPINAQINKETYRHDIDTLLKITFSRMCKFWLYPDFTFKMSKDYKIYSQLQNKFNKVFKYLFDSGREKYLDRSETEQNNNKSFFNLLLRKWDKKEILLEEIFEETNTMVAAGTDTTATSLSFLFYLLAMHPQIQEKLYSEVLEVMGPDRPVCLEDLNKLPYTENVIKETLRIFPSIPFILRQLTKDVSCGEIILPEGSTILIPIISLHRNEKYWKDPLKFDPDRFLPENGTKIYPNSYIPFAGGPRRCIGFTYANYALKIATATLIRKFRFSTQDPNLKIEDIELATNIVLKTTKEMKLIIEMR